MTPGFFMRTAKDRIVAMGIQPRRALCLSVAALILVVVACVWFFTPRNRITQENYDRIQNGMSRQEVEHTLGHYTDSSFWGEIAETPGIYETECYIWEEATDYITVTLAKGLVVNKHIHIGTAWEQIKWRCGRLTGATNSLTLQ